MSPDVESLVGSESINPLSRYENDTPMIQVIHSLNEPGSEQIHYKQPVCVKCSRKLGRIVRMYVKNNGVFIPYGQDSAQVGDLLVCPVCLTEIIQGFSEILNNSVSGQFLESDYAILKGVKDLPI